MTELYLGLISGTSVDGVDALLADFSDGKCQVIAARTIPYPSALDRRVRTLIESGRAHLAELGSLDVALGRFFADCALALIREAELRPSDVRAIGHHGQTVFHKPAEPEPFTMQIGDPNSIAALTGITTVADFRRLDMAVGGQGAPMVPAFHDWLFRSGDETRVILNIGGISNVTVLAPGAPTLGFDTGPGNTLLDLWISRCRGQPYDVSGALAASGEVDARLLEALLNEPYFDLPPPKSTGRELFNNSWLNDRLDAQLPDRATRLEPANVQATLAELTATSIANGLAATGYVADRVVVCGGGAHNDDLLRRLTARLSCPVQSSAEYGLEPDWVEAAAFAWLAAARLERRAGNMPSVTGAHQAVTLGGVYCGADKE